MDALSTTIRSISKEVEISSNKHKGHTELKTNGGSDYNLQDYGYENDDKYHNKLKQLNRNFGNKHQMENISKN